MIVIMIMMIKIMIKSRYIIFLVDFNFQFEY